MDPETKSRLIVMGAMQTEMFAMVLSDRRACVILAALLIDACHDIHGQEHDAAVSEALEVIEAKAAREAGLS